MSLESDERLMHYIVVIMTMKRQFTANSTQNELTINETKSNLDKKNISILFFNWKRL